MMARIAVMFEASGIIRNALIAQGFDAVSIDLRATDRPGPHIQGDVFDHLEDGWGGAVMHPDCTYLCSSGLHWNKRVLGRDAKTKAALANVRRLMACSIPVWAIENPMGCIGTKIRPANQIVQPYQFGEDASKATCFWTRGLPTLMPTERFNGRWVRETNISKPVERWANQTDSGQNRLAPSDDRWAARSETYPGIAAAIAKQWGPYLSGWAKLEAAA
jgi:hypothetical protein